MTRAEELALMLMERPMLAEGICQMDPLEFSFVAEQAYAWLKHHMHENRSAEKLKKEGLQ